VTYRRSPKQFHLFSHGHLPDIRYMDFSDVRKSLERVNQALMLMLKQTPSGHL
jgi:hypothetical protein